MAHINRFSESITVVANRPGCTFNCPMSFQAGDQVWKDLSISNQVQTTVFTEIVKGTTLGLLENGPLSLKSLRAFAQSTNDGTSGDDLLKLAEAIALVLAEAARLNLNQYQFSVFAGQGLKGDKLDLLEKVYQEKADELRDLVLAISKNQDTLPRFVDLRWRLDCILGSKAIRDVVQPDFLVQLTIKEGVSDNPLETKTFLDCSPDTMKHLEFVLEEALKQSYSAHSRRMGRV
eukprot:TRINITY_DN13208_c0_g2_i1.p1 TRINITY_DN13208_c0_g2~~TRINITY_DN13208_c0_g2_i1.p1  ORF type:complete len:233 (+),score=49.71 TRINITY_DN13208_c0_g2_i1:274-972(+)